MPKKEKRSKARKRQANSAAHFPHQPNLHQPVNHCQPSLSTDQLAICISRQCPHCNDCLPCRTAADIKWNHDLIYGSVLDRRVAEFRREFESLHGSDPSIREDNQAFEIICKLEDEKKALLAEVALLKEEVTNIRQQGKRRLVDEVDAQDGDVDNLERVKRLKLESETDEVEEAGLGDDEVDAQDDDADHLDGVRRIKLESNTDEVEEAEFADHELAEDELTEDDMEEDDSAQSEHPKSESLQRIKREPAEDGISVSSDMAKRPSGVVVIPRFEQPTGPHHFNNTPRRTRKQKPREVTLRAPRATTEKTRAAYVSYDKREDAQLIHCLRKGYNSFKISRKYLPNRTPDSIRTRKKRLLKKYPGLDLSK